MNYDEWRKYNIRDLLWIMDSRITRIERSTLGNTTMILQLLGKENAMTVTAQTILDKVAEVKDRTDAESVLLDEVHQMMVDARAQNDPALMDQAIAQLDAIRQGAVDAITRNTDADPNAQPTP